MTADCGRRQGSGARTALAVGSAAHIPALDGLRGLAILLVLAWHLLPARVLEGSLLLAPLKLVRDSGWAGVDLFFVLSGFLITSILLQNKDSNHYFQAFYARRVLRIVPLYYLLLAACIFALPNLWFLEKYDYFWQGEGDPLWYWLFLANFRYLLDVPGHQFLGVTWSLSIEEQYYIVWPLVVWIFKWRSLVIIEILLIALSFFLRIYLVELSGISPKFAYFFTLSHLDGLAVGGLIALGASRGAECARVLDLFAALLPVWVCVSVGIAGYSIFLGGTRYSAFDPVMLDFGYLANALLFGALLVRCTRRSGWVPTVFQLVPLRSVGKYSYAMYLLHWPTFFLVKELLAGAGIGVGAGWTSDVALFVLSCAATYTAGYVSWRCFEGPINGLKRHFRF